MHGVPASRWPGVHATHHRGKEKGVRDRLCVYMYVRDMETHTHNVHLLFRSPVVCAYHHRVWVLGGQAGYFPFPGTCRRRHASCC
jgi:hypothetical protein